MNAGWTIFLIALTIATGSIVVDTIRLGISPMPSNAGARRAMLELVPHEGDGQLFDLGSGFGTLAFSAAHRFPARQVIGYEASVVPYLISRGLQLVFPHKNLRFVRSDLLEAEISGAIVLTYLFPGGMQDLAEKVKQQPPLLLISNTFALPGVEAKTVVRLDDLYKSPIYTYHFHDRI